MAFEKVEILGVPISIVGPEKTEEAVLELLAMSGMRQVMFLSVWDLLKARGKGDYAECVRSADVVLPVSKSILWAAEFLKKAKPVRHNPFTFLIDFLSVLEKRGKSVYLLGGYQKSLFKAHARLRSTYPNLHIVGKYPGYFQRQMEADVCEAIYKCSPSLVLVSEGLKEKDLWAFRRKHKFTAGIFMYYNDAVGIFSERKKKLDEKTFEKGREVFSEIARNPLKIFLVFPFAYFVLLAVWHRLFVK